MLEVGTAVNFRQLVSGLPLLMAPVLLSLFLALARFKPTYWSIGVDYVMFNMPGMEFRTYVVRRSVRT